MDWESVRSVYPEIEIPEIENFVKAMNQDGEAFKYICNKFPVLSQAKLKEGIFVGTHTNKF